MDIASQHHAIPVVRRTPEWGWLEYLLQVSCRTWKLRLRAGWSVANKRLAIECEQRCQGLLQLHAWVPVADLPTSESVEDICQNGFRVGHIGTSFHVGNVKLPGMFREAGMNNRGHGVRNRGRSLPAGRRLYEFLLCRVGVGRAYNIESAAQAETMDLPPEYDSFFIRHDPTDEQALEEDNYPGVLPRHLLHHEYIIRDAAQALPVYLVHFEYDPELPESLALPLCDNCGLQAALLYCEADDGHFCQACDAKIHASNTIAARHQRVDINRRPSNPIGHCPDHPEVEADKFCLECKYPICHHCKSIGSHSTGESQKHKTDGILQAYERSLQHDNTVQFAGLPDRAHVEQRLVAELDAKLVAVQESGQRAEDGIYNQIQEAVRQGQELAEDQASLFLSDELEAKRQLEQDAWLECFLEEKVKSLPPADFLDTWLRHVAVREEVAKNGSLSRPRASAGLRVEGGIRLIAEAAPPVAPRKKGVGKTRFMLGDTLA